MKEEISEDIKKDIKKILQMYDDDEMRCGGYWMTQYSHITAPEDYTESRTEWCELRNRADDMYYTLSDIKTILLDIKDKLDKINGDVFE